MALLYIYIFVYKKAGLQWHSNYRTGRSGSTLLGGKKQGNLLPVCVNIPTFREDEAEEKHTNKTMSSEL